MEKELQEKRLFYDPSEKDREKIQKIYKYFSYMRDQRGNRYNYFNDRTLKEFIDDSELRLTGYVPTREEQGKEEWQANFVHPVTLNKMKAILASVALDVPATRIKASNEKNMKSWARANVIKNLVKHSYDVNTNKEEDIFFEAWENAGKGTVHVYEGYLKTKQKRKFIKSFNPVTGEVEFDEKEVITNDDCTNFIIPIENIYIWDFYVPKIQDQVRIQWIEKMDRSTFRDQFGNYPNAKYVKTTKELIGKDLQARYFMEGWSTRITGHSPIEVIRHYDKHHDEYVIIANGVLLLDAPLLLGKKKKWYPIAKTIYQPFAADFYYGNSLPNGMMGEQDVIDALYNSAVDKTYKSMVPPLLIGNVNKDDFDLEDTVITHDTKIYVQDINQVKPLESSGMKTADIKMIELISRGLDMTTVDGNQGGVAGRGTTAREVVIAHENAKKLKGILYMFLTSLWVQKIKLRILNILTFYTKAKPSGDSGDEVLKKFLVEGTTLSDGTKGTMGINISSDKTQLPTPEQLTTNEKDFKEQNPGENYEEMSITSDYLDDWEYDVEVIPETVYESEGGYTRSNMEDKIKMLGGAFPQYFMQNQEKLFKEALIAFNNDPDDYETKQPQQPPQGMNMGEGAQPQGQPQAEAQATAGQSGLPQMPQ